MNKVLAWSRLMRLSNLPTAWSNILMGMVITCGHWELWPAILLLTISSCMYLGGMILNDVCDIDRDRTERPSRVLPLGEISVVTASRVGHLLLIIGPVLAALFTLETSKSGTLYITGPATGTAVALGVVILAYNYGGKNSAYGPILMGLCRVLNVLLGTSLTEWDPFFLEHGRLSWYVAGSIGLFVAGITLFAKGEHKTSGRYGLVMAALIMSVAIAALLYLPYSHHLWVSDNRNGYNTPVRVQYVFCGMLVMMLIPAYRRMWEAIRQPNSINVQRGVVASLQALIMIDATLCFLFAFNTPVYAIVVALLVIPRFVLGRFISST